MNPTSPRYPTSPTSTWHFTGWPCQTPALTPSFTTGWTSKTQRWVSECNTEWQEVQSLFWHGILLPPSLLNQGDLVTLAQGGGQRLHEGHEDHEDEELPRAKDQRGETSRGHHPCEGHWAPAVRVLWPVLYVSCPRGPHQVSQLHDIHRAPEARRGDQAVSQDRGHQSRHPRANVLNNKEKAQDSKC